MFSCVCVVTEATGDGRDLFKMRSPGKCWKGNRSED